MFNYFKTWIACMMNDEGQGMVEYVLLVSLIAIAVIAVLLLLGPAIAAEFQQIVDRLTA